MSNVGETTLEIDLSALAYNYSFLKSKIDPATKFMAVVKAFAYGSDMVAIARKLQALGVDYLAVAYTKEGILLREAGITLPILVLHPQPIYFKKVIEHCLEPSIYSISVLEGFMTTAKQQAQAGYPIHLKFNTGLNRLGFEADEIDAVLATLEHTPAIKIKGVLSHLAASEAPTERNFTVNQIEAFAQISDHISSSIGYQPLCHLLNTSGILNYPQAQHTMVRSGIGLYGYGNHQIFDEQLQPVVTLKTVISQLHKIQPGESVGYNRAYIAIKPTITATLPIGHADGIGRHYGDGRTYVLVNGKKAPIIGNVCMDMIMVDVTAISCKEGDEVVVFGKENSAEDFAHTGNSISYEILTAISSRVSRVIKD